MTPEAKSRLKKHEMRKCVGKESVSGRSPRKPIKLVISRRLASFCGSVSAKTAETWVLNLVAICVVYNTGNSRTAQKTTARNTTGNISVLLFGTWQPEHCLLQALRAGTAMLNTKTLRAFPVHGTRNTHSVNKWISNSSHRIFEAPLFSPPRNKNPKNN